MWAWQSSSFVRLHWELLMCWDLRSRLKVEHNFLEILLRTNNWPQQRGDRGRFNCLFLQEVLLNGLLALNPADISKILEVVFLREGPCKCLPPFSRLRASLKGIHLQGSLPSKGCGRNTTGQTPWGFKIMQPGVKAFAFPPLCLGSRCWNPGVLQAEAAAACAPSLGVLSGVFMLLVALCKAWLRDKIILCLSRMGKWWIFFFFFF